MPIENLQRVPDSVPNEVAVFTEPLSAVVEIPDHDMVRISDRVILSVLVE